LVTSFIEKPSVQAATAYLEEGGYYWNSGIYPFDPDIMLEEFKNFRSDILDSARAAFTQSKRRGDVVELPDDLFAAVPSESLDVAVMELTRRAAVMPLVCGWADVGSWSEVLRLGPVDTFGNLSGGDVTAVETRGRVVWSDGPPIAVLGLEDLVVVAANGCVLVVPRARAQDVKQLVERLGVPPREGSQP